MSKKMVLILLSVTMITMMLAAGCGSDDPDESTLEKAQRLGYVTVGFANEAPFSYETPDGQLTGQNVEIARAVLENLGITEMEGVLTEFGSLIPGLQAKRFDIITAGAYITPERMEEVAFADPEYRIGGGLAVQAGNPLNLTSYQDVADNPDVKIGVLAGGAEHDHLLDVGASEDQFVLFPDGPSAMAALQAGQVDTITATSMGIRALVENANDPGIEYVEDFEVAVVDGKPQAGYGSSAFRHEDTDFLEAYNRELKKLKDSGELLEIQKQFGFTEAEFPGYITAEEAAEVFQ